MSVYDVNGTIIAGEGEGNVSSVRRRPYWVLHLDCGRKYFSVANLKTIIDRMELRGLNQLQLHFAENRGLRFQLNDMTITTTDGTQYDLTPCVSTDLGGALSESDMDEVIVYARSKDIDIVPSLDMPGHMTKILTQFPQFKYYDNYAWTLDATDSDAVKFALALVEKYATYFKSRGCNFWNIGADEVGYNGSVGRWAYLTSTDIPTFVSFVNQVAELVTSMGLIPRAFNDGIIYGGDYANLFNKNIEIYNWCSAGIMGENGIRGVGVLTANDYTLINANYNWYFIVPGSNSNTSNPAVENANILKVFNNGTTTYDQSGACICIWCDGDATADGGNAALPSIIADIDSLGYGISLTLPNISYPII